MNHYLSAVQEAARMIGHIDHWLDAAVAHGKARSFDPELLLQARLAPDQFPLVRQIQSACDRGKYLAARLAGKNPPSHPDTETTIAQLRERVAKVVAYLGEFTEADFADADAVKATFPWLPGKFLDGHAYLHQFELPNFYFHVSHAYAILRHSGVDLGKRGFLGTAMPFQDL